MKTLSLVLHLSFIILVSSASAKPNVLFIISDDLTDTALGCYGNKVSQTPNIDRLASRGMRFTRAYCQASYCGPSRASFLSGYYPHATGVQGYISPRAAIGDRATWPQHFKNAGYYSARVSKIFHMGVPGGIENGGDGTFVSANDMQANRCFLYHLIGNGTGQWRVPQGGMGALVRELYRIATLHGVEIKTQSKVSVLESGPAGVRFETESGETYTAKDLLFAAAPQLLARLLGRAVPESLEVAQLKINMLLSRLPRLKSGVDPRLAFAGTFHINESYIQWEAAYARARGGEMPQPLPLEMYCHTLTDPSILSAELIAKGFHTLTIWKKTSPYRVETFFTVTWISRSWTTTTVERVRNSGSMKPMIRIFTSPAQEPDAVAESAASLGTIRLWHF